MTERAVTEVDGGNGITRRNGETETNGGSTREPAKQAHLMAGTGCGHESHGNPRTTRVRDRFPRQAPLRGARRTSVRLRFSVSPWDTVPSVRLPYGSPPFSAFYCRSPSPPPHCRP